jgi:hypothetical protein
VQVVANFGATPFHYPQAADAIRQAAFENARKKIQQIALPFGVKVRSATP